MNRDLQTIRTDLIAFRQRFLAGDLTAKDDMDALAKEAAAVYNAKARKVAKRMGVRPRLTTPERIMRQGEYLR